MPPRLAWVGLVLVVLGAVAEEGEMLHVPDAGRRLAIGELYDARTDKQVSGSLWSKELIDNMMVEKPAQSSVYRFAYGDSFSHKSSLLDLSLEFALSFMGGDVKVDGSFKYLNDKRRTNRAVRMSLMHMMRTVQHNIDPFHDSMMNGMNLGILGKDIATHVVTGVTYGANAIATFESTYENEAEAEEIGVYFRLNLLVDDSKINIGVNVNISDQESSILNRTSVSLNGDIVPPVTQEIPSRPFEALKFMRQMHQFSLGEDGKGVGITLELTPLTWLYGPAAKLKNAIAADLVERVIAVYESLDVSEELILDLVALNEGPFRAWKDDAEGYYRAFLLFRTRFAANLAETVSRRRNGTVDIDALSNLLVDYWNNPMSETAIRQTVEQKRDNLLNLLALVDQLAKADVTLAESYSDYQAPTFNSLYDRVYVLVIVGMIPSSDREGISRVREFTQLAFARQTSAGRRKGVKHCLTRQPVWAPEPICVEHQKFIVIHFDSFCEEFCPARFCAPPGFGAACPMTSECTVYPGVPERLGCWPRTATCDAMDPLQQNTLTQPLSECWCACPRTQILEYQNSQGPVRLEDHLPVVPDRPTIINVTGAAEGEEHPLEQRIRVVLSDDPLGLVRNFRVRVLWHEATQNGNQLKWVQRERIVDTRDSERTILISSLASGQRYKFEVAGVNNVGEGPYSVPFPTGDLYISHNRPMVTPRVTLNTRHDEPPLNVLPGWKNTRGTGVIPVDIVLSTPAKEKIDRVEFWHNNTVWFSCTGYSGATVSRVKCDVQIRDRPVSGIVDVDVVTVVFGISGDIIAWGPLTLQGPSERSCWEWEDTRWLLCDTEIASVVGALDFELDPLHQIVDLVLSGSTHKRDLLRFMVRVTWREAGKADEQERTFDTLSDERVIRVMELVAGQTYFFSVAGVGKDGQRGPYSGLFPKGGLKVGHIMPVVRPVGWTHHYDVPVNRVPGWFFNSTGKMDILVSLSVAAEEPLGKLTFNRIGVPAVVVECANYGLSTTMQVSCTLPLAQFPSDDVVEAKVWGLNGALLGHVENFRVEHPSVESCSLWEPIMRKHCNISDHSVSKCVEKCDDCTFNTVTTTEYVGACLTNRCPESQTWCPETEKCFDNTLAADKGCTALCSGDSVYNPSKRFCALPCELQFGQVVAPGVTAEVKCPAVHIKKGSPVMVKCPADNTERVQHPGGGLPAASWSPPAPNCEDCNVKQSQTLCHGFATEMASTADRTQCLCVKCKTGYMGSTCNECATGYINFPECQRCSTSEHCNSRAHGVTSNSGKTACQCNCRTGYEGSSCQSCSAGYVGWPNCYQCTLSGACNGHATSVVPADGQTKCSCSCQTGYTGDSCNACASGYQGYPNCILCNVNNNCNGRATAATKHPSLSLCLCTCRAGFTGATCNSCASNYGPGPWPQCYSTWTESGTSCSRGYKKREYYKAKNCGYCTTPAGWRNPGDRPTCSIVIFTRITCTATEVTAVTCSAFR